MPPSCAEAARSAASFMDGCVAVAVAQTEVVTVDMAEAVAVAMAVVAATGEIHPTITTQTRFVFPLWGWEPFFPCRIAS